MRGVVALLWCILSLAAAQRATFTASAGIEVDPCASGVMSVTGPAQCTGNGARAARSSTIMLPASDSANLVGTHAGIFGGNENLAFTGNNLNEANLQFFLATANGDCTNPDNTLAIVRCTVVGGGQSPCTLDATGQTIQFLLPTTRGARCGGATCWNDAGVLSARQALGLEEPRLLCSRVGDNGAGSWTGFRIGTAWNCESAVTDPNSRQLCTIFNPTGPTYAQLRPEQRRLLRANTQCCKSTIGLRVGICINAAHQNCCGIPYNLDQRCCSATRQIVQAYNRPCPCRSVGGDADCPGTERCCLPFKYEEFRDNNTPSGVMAGRAGVCYNNQISRCCDTGDIYDPGAQQCCSINGVQSLNIPCPCDIDEDCIGGQREFQHSIRDFKCCRQTDPVPYERETDQKEIITANGRRVSVSRYANFPSGTGSYAIQRCTGSCIDVRFQICCNGVACVQEYERCCNNTCCNRFTETCTFGKRAPTTNNQFNYIDFRVTYYQCTAIEALNPIKSFFIYVLPTALLIATALAFGIVMVFANKAANRSYSTLERAIIAVCTIIILLSLFLFFSPAYKYGLVAILAALIAVLAAAARIRWLNIAALVIVFIAILYVFDPFPANNILGFSSWRYYDDDNAPNDVVDDDGEVGAPNVRTMGLLHTIDLMFRDDQDFCVDWYDYFRFDPQLRDEERCDNPEVTSFGYCDRAFIFILLLAAAIIMILLLLLFILLVLALFLRFIKPPPAAPVELELVPEPEAAPLIVEQPPVLVEQPIIAPMVVDPLLAGAPLSPLGVGGVGFGGLDAFGGGLAPVGGVGGLGGFGSPIMM